MDTTVLQTRFVTELQSHHPANTVRSYAVTLRLFFEQLKGQPITIETLLGFYRWVGRREYSRSTIEARLAGMKRFVDWLLVEDLLSLTPRDVARLSDAKRNLLRRRQSPLPRTPAKGLDEQLLAAARQLPQLRDRALVELLFSSGCRRSEIIGLNIGDVNLGERSAVVKGKNDKKRTAYFSQNAAAAIAAYLAQRPDHAQRHPLFCRHRKGGVITTNRLSVSSVANLVKQLCRLAEIDPASFSPHSFRHAFAIRVLRKTKNLAVVQDLLGHESPGSTRIYATIYPDELQAAHQDVFGEL